MTPGELANSTENLAIGTSLLDWLTVLAAFAGFTLGSFITYSFNLRLQERREEREAKAIALELRAELVSLYDALKDTYETFCKGIAGEQRQPIEILRFVYFGDSTVYQSQVGRLGRLPTKVTEELIEFHARRKYFRDMIEANERYYTVVSEFEEDSVRGYIPTERVQVIAEVAIDLMRLIPAIAHELAQFAGRSDLQGPWWTETARAEEA